MRIISIKIIFIMSLIAILALNKLVHNDSVLPYSYNNQKTTSENYNMFITSFIYTSIIMNVFETYETYMLKNNYVHRYLRLNYNFCLSCNYPMIYMSKYKYLYEPDKLIKSCGFYKIGQKIYYLLLKL